MKVLRLISALFFIAAAVLATPSWASSRLPYSHSDMRAMKRDAAKGDTDAMANLGSAYRYGYAPGYKSDQKQALKWYLKAAEAGNTAGMRGLAGIYGDRDERRYDEALAFHWLEKAANLGDVFAQGHLAGIYERSDSRRDYAKAFEWNLKAALQGDEWAVRKLQTAYVYENTMTSFEAVFERLTTEAESGDVDAAWRLAYLLMIDDFGRKDEVRARALLESAVSKGSPQAMFWFVLFFCLGDHEEGGESRSIALLRQAADAGYIPARLLWINLYQSPINDTGVEDPNERLIFEWYLDAAERGYEQAQSVLFYYYSNGSYVAKDRDKATKWRLLSMRWPDAYWRDERFIPDISPESPEDAEGRRRADAWLAAHPEPYWPRDDFSR